MVNVVKDWNQMEEYAEFCRIGQYQVTQTLDGTEVRVFVGRFGYIKTFKDPKDPDLNRILEFCIRNNFIEVISNIPDEQFFKTTFPGVI